MTSRQISLSPGCLVSVGIFAYNEEVRISGIIHEVNGQLAELGVAYEVIVMSCGSDDSTNILAQRELAEVPRGRLVAHPTRRGKLSALAHFSTLAEGRFFLLCSADVFPSPGAVRALVSEACSAEGPVIVGARVVPSAAGAPARVAAMTRVLWDLHHLVAVDHPKLGEMIAVSGDAVRQVTTQTVHCDEVLLESQVTRLGGRLVYLPECTVHNFSVVSLRLLFSQRRRIHCQHLTAKAELGYRPATFGAWRIGRAVISASKRSNLKALLAMCLLEAAARIAGRLDFIRGEVYRVWTPTSATTAGATEAPSSLGREVA